MSINAISKTDTPSPVCISRKGAPGERWRGTKAQLATLGIRLDGPWPKEPGGARRWAAARDEQGRLVSITCPAAALPGQFEAYISAPMYGADLGRVPASRQPHLTAMVSASARVRGERRDAQGNKPGTLRLAWSASARPGIPS